MSNERYGHGDIECIDAIKAALTSEEFRGFCKGNIIKYIWRERYKGGREDLEKAADYIKWVIDTYKERDTDKDAARGPLDADGMLIRVGDVMEWPTTGETFEVVGLGDGVLFYVEDGEERADWTEASTKRHYHPPTVDDVLMEFHERMDELGTTDQCVGSERADAVDALLRERADTIAEYAKRLRLAGDAE